MPLLLLILAEVLLFLGILAGSGIVDRINQNDCDSMDRQVATRKDRLQSTLLELSSETLPLAESINVRTQALVDAGVFEPDEIEEAKASDALLKEAIEPMVASLRLSGASGVFVILNTSDLAPYHETGDYGRKPGLLICDFDPNEPPSVRNDDLVLRRAPASVVESFPITTAADWKPTYDFAAQAYVEEYDSLYVPFQYAFEGQGKRSAKECGHWSVAPTSGGSNPWRSIAYSVPLMLKDGTIYGVAGFELGNDYLDTLLPYDELFNEDDGSYMIARVDAAALDVGDGETTQVSPVLCDGYRPIENTQYGQLFSITKGSGSKSAYHTVNGQYYISAEMLNLYDRNGPFEDEAWLLLGIMPQATLHSFSDQAVGMIGVAALFMLLLGFVGSILLGRSVARPLRGLSNEVAQAELEGSEQVDLSSTGIEEVDRLTSAISTLSAKVASAHKLEQERLEYERDFDLLTGLMNRRAFYRRAEAIFANADVLKFAAIVMLDLDNLKVLNDAYGHDCGDKYIRQAARCFESSVPENVLVARVSGDEFFLLFYGYDNREQIEADIEKLRQAIPVTEFVLPDGKVAHINASGGVALYLEDAKEFAELMKLADFTMYQVKESGKNNIAYFDLDTYQRKSSALRAMAEFDDLMGNFDLSVYHFQPIFDARTGEVFAYEALMRVSLGLLQNPLDVIRLARSEGRLVEIERMTWTRSLECFEDLLAQGKVSSSAYLFINSFASLSLEEDELAALSQAHSDVMAKVVIEVTEDEDMDEQATSTKRSIPGTTGYFALDDYGSGYNSEVKLLTLNPKFVKVDISIIRNIHASKDKQSLVSQAVEYAHARDMYIVAEGIESAEELDALLELGVDYLQGYYLARPGAEPEQLHDEALARIVR